MLRKVIALALLGATGWGQASWRAATSDHFVVYTEGNEASARDAAVGLEKFQVALRHLTGAKAPASPVKVRVFLVAGPDAVAATMPFAASGIAGYYSASLRGPFTVMARTDIRGVRGSRGEVLVADQKARQILFHELTHHFAHQYFPAAYPTWYSEGFAEFMGAIEIEPNDVVVLGQPVQGRYGSFLGNGWLHAGEMLTAKSYRDVKQPLHLLYAEGWLLVHYLTVTNGRPGQLKAYLEKVNAGAPFDRAAREAFGDLDKLNAELRAYAGRGKLQAVALPFKKLETGPITVRALSGAEAAMLSFDIRLHSGVPAGEAADFADRVAAAARTHGDDPYALGLVTEAQRLAGRTAEAQAAAERWAAVAPADGLAIAAKADALADRLAQAKVTDVERWREVRRLYADAVKKAPADPRPLHGFYRSYLRQGVTPPASAQNALYAAFELLPQDDDLRYEVAADFEGRGMIREAIAVIRPAAFEASDPSELSPREKRRRDADKVRYRLAGEADHETAREMLTRLERKAGTQASAAR